MNSSRLQRAAAVLGSAAVLAVAAAGPAAAHNGDDHTTPPAPGGYGSKAQAVEANLHDIPVGPLTVARWPGGPLDAKLTGSQHYVEFGVLEAHANGSYTQGWASAEASVASVVGGIPNVLSVNLKEISSSCRSDASGITGGSIIKGGSITVLGKSIAIPLNPAPNTSIGIPGLLEVILNEQVKNPDGSLTVTAIDIHPTQLVQSLSLSMHPIYLTLAQTNCDAVTPPLTVPMADTKVAAGIGGASLVGILGVFLLRRRRGLTVAA